MLWQHFWRPSTLTTVHEHHPSQSPPLQLSVFDTINKAMDMMVAVMAVGVALK